MAHGFTAFIDESGSEGGSHGQGSSEWFALSAFVCKTSTDTAGVFEAYNQHVKNRAGDRFKKYCSLNPKNRILITRLVGSAPHSRVAHILIHKPSLTDEKMRRDHTRLYKYGVRFLLERISWICRDAKHPPEHPLCHVTFSERRGFPYDEIADYLAKLKGDPKCRIDWKHLDPSELSVCKHQKSDGCRLADVVAGALTQSVEFTEFEITDDRMIRNLAPVTYVAAQSNQLRGNGLKIFPKEAEVLQDKEARFSWLRTHYPK